LTTARPPRVDVRTFEDLRSRVIALARAYAPEWQPGSGDAGTTLVAVYAHFLETLLDRLNRVPEKDLLAFLDLLGVGLLPPGAAHAPVVFSLAATAGGSGTVARRTQVATVQTETRPAVVFETVQDLTVVAARLVAAGTVDTDTDRWSDRSAMARGQDPAVFAPFEGDRPLDHLLYIGADPLLHVREGTLELTITATGAPTGWEGLLDPVTWEAFRAGAWERLGAPRIVGADAQAAAQLVFGSFAGADLTAALPATGVQADGRWIRGRMRFPHAEYRRLAAVDDALTLSKSLRVRHAAGSSLVQLRRGRGTRLAADAPLGSGVITLVLGTGFAEGDVVEVGTGGGADILTLGPFAVSPAVVTVPVTPATRWTYQAGLPVTKLTVPARTVETTLAANAAVGDISLLPSSADGFAAGDVVRIGNPPAGPLTDAVDVDCVEVRVAVGRADRSVTPDRVHVNGSPVDATSTFLPLGPNPRPGDTFAVASEEAFAKIERGRRLPSGGLVEVRVRCDPSDAKLTWEYLRTKERTWAPLSALALRDATAGLTQDGEVTVSLPDDAESGTFPGDETSYHFLRVRLASGGYRRVPRLQGLEAAGRAPLRVFTSEAPVVLSFERGGVANPAGLTPNDPRLPLLPFGTSPRAGNTMTVAVPGALADVRLTVILAQTAWLHWEYSTADGWKPLGDSSTRSPSGGPNGAEFLDTTHALIRDGEIRFRRPADFAPLELDGQAGHWIRARLVSGEYGAVAEVVPAVPGDPSKGFQFRQGTGAPNPPLVDAVTLSYEADTSTPAVFTRNGFGVADRTAHNAPGGGTYRPFTPEAEPASGFYLGLDRAPPNDAVTVLLATPPQEYVEPLPEVGGTPDPSAAGVTSLTWEYWNGVGWTPLSVSDGTDALSESGFVRFVGPPDIGPSTLFDDPLPRYWIRVRRLGRGAEGSLLSGVFLNAVEAEQATTIRDEVIGSSSGEADQVFRAARPPVFPGQVVTVVEPELPPGDEHAAIRDEEGDDAIQVLTVSGGEEVQVRWHEVATFAHSGPRSRHYTVERIPGRFAFGDGVRGLIPPAGRDNILASRYRSGGGPDGNQPAGAINQLKTSIPYIASVTNPVPADGGAAAETVDGVVARGPQLVRHRRRAVTPDDYEWLAREVAGNRVARVCALPNRDRSLRFAPGWVTVIVVPDGPERKPLPSPQLVRDLENGLAPLSPVVVSGPTPRRINVVGPGYVPVELAAEVVATDPTHAEAARRGALIAIDGFLHPLTGGPDRTGWEFGRDVYLSEVRTVLEAVPAVDHVRSVAFQPTVGAVPLVLSDPPEQIADLPPGTVVTTRDGALAAVLVEQVRPAPLTTDAMVVIFREGERVRVGTAEDTVTTTVRRISGSILAVDPFHARVGHPTGTSVTPVDGNAHSVLTAAVEAGSLVSQMAVRGLAPGDELVFPESHGVAGTAVSLVTTGSGHRARLVLGGRLRVPELHLVASGANTVTVS
jgi:hypothetical protein